MSVQHITPDLGDKGLQPDLWNASVLDENRPGLGKIKGQD